MTRRRGRLITLGSFDGVHLGHQALIQRTVAEARKRKLMSTAITFKQPPRMVLDPKSDCSLLSTQKEKSALLRWAGLDEVVYLDFRGRIQNLKPYVFFRDILLKRFEAKGLVVGLDFRFGKDRAGGVMDLLRWGMEQRIPVWVIPAVRRNKSVVSSTEIRRMLKSGDGLKAQRWLGHPYLVEGRVVKGRGRGRTLGYPTTNVAVPAGKVLPRGVFAVSSLSGSTSPKMTSNGVCNIGVRPTFYQNSPVTLEIHWLSGTPPRVGRSVTVALRRYLRAEKRFSSSVALVRQIGRDVRAAEWFFRSTKKNRPIFPSF